MKSPMRIRGKGNRQPTAAGRARRTGWPPFNPRFGLRDLAARFFGRRQQPARVVARRRIGTMERRIPRPSPS